MGPDSITLRVLVRPPVYMCNTGSSDVREKYQITGILVEARMSRAENSLHNGEGSRYWGVLTINDMKCGSEY